MMNPANIPELKEPSNYKDLTLNLKDVQNFLNQADNNAIFVKAISKSNPIKEILNSDVILCFRLAFTTQQIEGDGS